MSNLNLLRKAIRERGIDAVIIFNELNQRYLSGFAFTDGFLFISENKAELVTDFRYYEMAEHKAYRDFHISMPENHTKFLAELLSDGNVIRVGFEGASVSYKKYCELVLKHPSVEFVDIGNIILDLRQIKTSEEIKLIQRAQDVADKAFLHVINSIKPSMTEIDVAAELEYAMRKHGADGVSFDTIAVSGEASALPHGTPRNVRLKKGFLTMDFGAKVDGYCSDMTRTVVIGKADSDMKKLYNTVLSAQSLALDFLSEGKDCGEADKMARDLIDSLPEYKGTFGHSLGHSIGLYVHESPRLSRFAFGQKMRCGEIYTVEPGIYLLGKYGCRIEDMVLIQENGVYNFTHSTKELIEIF